MNSFSEHFSVIATTSLAILSTLFIFVIGILILAAVFIYFIDRLQTHNTILHNYPLLGRFRYIFESLGVFFRQYFFAMDREELPFNRADRTWVEQASQNIDNTRAFGSTRDLHPNGTIFFVNTAHPTLEEDAVSAMPMLIGPHAKQPYEAPSFFNISGMSYGALSKPAVRALSYGAKMAGCWLNTGEGGLAPYHLEGGPDVVFEIGTALYGVRDKQGNLSEEKLKHLAKHDQIKMFEIKLSQGAKPGKGGLLPAVKVTPEVAAIRGIETGKDSISPNRHRNVKSSDDLLDMIHYVRETTGKPVGFKWVMGHPQELEHLCESIHKRGTRSAPDFITIDSSDGGTGAAPMPLMDAVGMPLKESLPMTADALIRYDLRDRIRIITSGKLMIPRKAAWALAMGADFVVSARGFMFSLGCIQAMQCNRNTCPTGITTHNTRLQKGLDPADKAVRVMNYHQNIVKEVGMIAHSCGVTEPRELRRHHARMVTENGRSKGLDELYPYPETKFQIPTNKG